MVYFAARGELSFVQGHLTSRYHWNISVVRRREGSCSCGYSLTVLGAAQMHVEKGCSC